jgi:hypothetical protein
MSEESNRGLSNAAYATELFTELECALEALRKHPIIRTATRQLRDRVTSGEKIDKETLDTLVNGLEQQLAPLIKLQKIVDDLDPHTLSEKEFKELWPKSPKRIIQDALEARRLRERRILLQAKEAETNRWLARIAFIAAMIALAVPFIDKAWKLMGFP